MLRLIRLTHINKIRIRLLVFPLNSATKNRPVSISGENQNPSIIQRDFCICGDQVAKKSYSGSSKLIRKTLLATQKSRKTHSKRGFAVHFVDSSKFNQI